MLRTLSGLVLTLLLSAPLVEAQSVVLGSKLTPEMEQQTREHCRKMFYSGIYKHVEAFKGGETLVTLKCADGPKDECFYKDTSGETKQFANCGSKADEEAIVKEWATLRSKQIAASLLNSWEKHVDSGAGYPLSFSDPLGVLAPVDATEPGLDGGSRLVSLGSSRALDEVLGGLQSQVEKVGMYAVENGYELPNNLGVQLDFASRDLADKKIIDWPSFASESDSGLKVEHLQRFTTDDALLKDTYSLNWGLYAGNSMWESDRLPPIDFDKYNNSPVTPVPLLEGDNGFVFDQSAGTFQKSIQKTSVQASTDVGQPGFFSSAKSFVSGYTSSAWGTFKSWFGW